MTTKHLFAAIVAMACTPGVPGADQRDVQSILDKFQSVRPEAADLAIYELDWAPTLKAAREKAGREKRPILLIVVTNSFGNMQSGHC